jgi:hypothetical protein
MENKQSSKKRTLINIALVVGGFVAGSVIWGPGSNLMKSNDRTNESINKQSIEQTNMINTSALTEPQANQPAGLVLTEQDKELIGKTAAQYLIDHPENLVEAGKRLESNRDGEKMSNVVNTKDVLLESTYTPNYGPDNADVAVIEFLITCATSASNPARFLRRPLARTKMCERSLKISLSLQTVLRFQVWARKLVFIFSGHTVRINIMSFIIN